MSYLLRIGVVSYCENQIRNQWSDRMELNRLLMAWPLLMLLFSPLTQLIKGVGQRLDDHANEQKGCSAITPSVGLSQMQYRNHQGLRGKTLSLQT